MTHAGWNSAELRCWAPHDIIAAERQRRQLLLPGLGQPLSAAAGKPGSAGCCTRSAQDPSGSSDSGQTVHLGPAGSWLYLQPCPPAQTQLQHPGVSPSAAGADAAASSGAGAGSGGAGACTACCSFLSPLLVMVALMLAWAAPPPAAAAELQRGGEPRADGGRAHRWPCRVTCCCWPRVCSSRWRRPLLLVPCSSSAPPHSARPCTSRRQRTDMNSTAGQQRAPCQTHINSPDAAHCSHVNMAYQTHHPDRSCGGWRSAGRQR